MGNNSNEKDSIGKNLILALTSRERFEILKRTDLNISNEYINKWKNRKSIINSESFNTKLKYEGFTEEEYNYAIKDLNNCEKEKLYHKLSEMKWYKDFQDTIVYIDKKSNEKEDIIYDVGYAIRNFTLYAKNKVLKVTNKSKVKIENEAIIKIISSLNVVLANIIQKSLVEELYFSKEQNLLKGKTSQERYEAFIKNNFCKKESIISFYSKYPVLARIMTVKTEYFIENISEAIGRLNNNINEIVKELEINIENKNIINIDCNQGDSHQKGKGVIKFIFDNDIKLIYKPRNLEIAKNYYKFINWFNLNSGLLDLNINKAVYKDRYTFEKYIEYKDNTSENEIINYYLRFGELTSIIYFLCGTDMHAENLIVNGEYPCIVDLETLFERTNSLANYDSADAYAILETRDSVTSTGLLPFTVFNENIEGKGIDMSGLNGHEQKLPYKVLIPVNVMTDEMKFEYHEFVRPGAKNIPKLNNSEVDFKKYIKYILEGFRKACKFIINNKKYLCEENSILKIFKNNLVRQVIKGTNRYYTMLEFSYHPNCTKDFLEREKLLENLWGYPYKNKKVVKYEIEDMMFDDIPVFFTKCDSNDLITSNGEKIEKYYDETGVEKVLRRIKKFNSDELEKQIAYIITSCGLYEECRNEFFSQTVLNPFYKDSRDKIYYLDEAINIGKNLINSSIRSLDNKTINWNSVVFENGEYKISPLNEGFKDGLSGIALFFHKLYKLTSQIEYKQLSEITIDNAISKSYASKKIDINEGKVSILYPLGILYKDTNSYKYKEFINETMCSLKNNSEKICSRQSPKEIVDIIQVILSIYLLLREEDYLSIAEGLSIHIKLLLEKSNFYDIYLKYPRFFSETSLVFLRLGRFLDKKEYFTIAEKLAEYDAGNFRNEINSNNFIDEIQLYTNRFLLQKEFMNINMSNEIDSVIKRISMKNKEKDCIFDGNMGDVELLINYFKYNNCLEVNDIIDKKVEFVLSHKEYKSNIISNFLQIGIHKGLSGIGYELLRLSSINEVPSIFNIFI